jgi:hypothetical protein
VTVKLISAAIVLADEVLTAFMELEAAIPKRQREFSNEMPLLVVKTPR